MAESSDTDISATIKRLVLVLDFDDENIPKSIFSIRGSEIFEKLELKVPVYSLVTW